MFYRVYTHRNTIPVVTSHYCSKCDKIIIQKQSLIVEASHNDKGSFTTSSIKKREDEALETLKRRSNRIIDEAKHITAKSNFGNFRFNGRCNGCGNIEPWARIYIFDRLISGIRTVGLIDMLFISIGLLQKTSLSKFPMIMFIIVAIWLVSETFNFVYKIIMRSLIKKLPEQSLPKVFTTPEELNDILGTFNADTTK